MCLDKLEEDGYKIVVIFILGVGDFKYFVRMLVVIIFFVIKDFCRVN